MTLFPHALQSSGKADSPFLAHSTAGEKSLQWTLNSANVLFAGVKFHSISPKFLCFPTIYAAKKKKKNANKRISKRYN